MPKNSIAKKSALQYKKMYKALKPFVDFKIDLRKEITRGQKTVITKYFKEYTRLTAGKPYEIQVFRSNKRANTVKAQELGGQDTRLKKFKVAFVPKNSPHQKIKFNKKGEAYVKNFYVKATFIPLDPLRLATEDITEYVDGVIADRKEDSFSVQTGDYELGGTFSKSRVGERVNKLCQQYNNMDANNYFGNWLGGLFANEFHNQSDLTSYRKAKREAQITKDRALRKKEKNKRVNLFYWYDRQKESVSLTKTDTPPNDHCEAITKREYERFLNIGEI